MTFISKHGRVVLAAAGIFLLPTGAIAQDTATTTGTDPLVTQPVEEERDTDFPWGLLGLLGLAGLLGRKRGDDDRDIRVDARRDTRP